MYMHVLYTCVYIYVCTNIHIHTEKKRETGTYTYTYTYTYNEKDKDVKGRQLQDRLHTGVLRCVAVCVTVAKFKIQL